MTLCRIRGKDGYGRREVRNQKAFVVVVNSCSGTRVETSCNKDGGNFILLKYDHISQFLLEGVHIRTPQLPILQVISC